MRFLIDANLPRSTVEALEKIGHQVEFARDIGFAAAPDERIAAHALQISVLERFLVQSALVESLQGRLAIIDAERVRFRPPLVITN